MLIANGSFAHGISGTGALADSAAGRKECHAIEKGKSLADGQVVDTTHPWYGARVGIIPCVVAQNGQQWNEVLPQANRLKSEYGDNIDAILILMGTNDFNAGVPIGEWFTEEYVEVEAANGEPKSLQVRRHRMPNLDQSTFKGRINVALDSLKNMYPHKQIILMTPLHRGYAKFGETNIQPDENYTNRCGEYIDAYINAVKEAGNVWAVPVIDLSAVSGIFPLNRSQKEYFPRDKDRLHPTDEGHARMAQAIMAALRGLAPRFE